ncbi:MAG: FeoA family protein [Schaalia turicensis]|nr:FeoA family protein [Schaalia turicensis]
MLLSKCPRNSRGRLVSIDVDSAYRLRLQELGLRPGAEFFVANRAAFGGVVINIAGTHIAAVPPRPRSSRGAPASS